MPVPAPAPVPARVVREGPGAGAFTGTGKLRSLVPIGLVTALALLACGRGGEPAIVEEVTPPTPSAPELLPLQVELTGCEGGERGANTCVVSGPAALTLWVEGETAPQLLVDGVLATPRRIERIDDGWFCQLEVAAGAKIVSAEQGGALPWSVNMVVADPQPLMEEIFAMLPDQNSAGRSPKLEAALLQIEAKLPAMHPIERAEALRLATVLTWDLGRDAAAIGRRALTAAIDAGDPKRIVGSANLLIHMLEQNQAEANWVLDLETLYIANVTDGRDRIAWQLDVAYAALDEGETVQGIAHLRAAEKLSRRLGQRDTELGAVARLSVELGMHGREAERAEAIERFMAHVGLSDEDTACDDATSVNNAAASLVYAKLSGTSAVDPEPMLRLALGKFETDAVRCEIEDNADLQDGLGLAHAHFVLAAVLDQRWDVVEERLRWFDGRKLRKDRRVSVAVSRAELALARDDVDGARRHLRGLPADTELVEWRRQFVLGRVEERSGNQAAALAGYLEAERVIDALAAGAGLEPARDGETLGIHAGAAHAITLLAAAGRSAEAAAVARGARARALRPAGRAARLAALSPEQRRAWGAAIAEYGAARDRIATELTTAWTLPTDARKAMLRGHQALRTEMQSAHERAFEILATAKTSGHATGEPGDGQLWLLFHPAPTGWFGIAMRKGDVTVRALEGTLANATPDMLAGTLLAPFDAEIGAAQSIKILAMGPLLEVPFHELPWRSKPLIEHAPVTWAVDFAVASAPSPGTRALVVADPATVAPGVGRLPHAGEEARVVADALAKGGWPVESLLAEQATLPDVLTHLSNAGWLHYAGHGLTDTTSAWDAALPLAGEAQLTVRDILTVTRVPRTVVLSGCRTAATHAGGLSLATAFVLAGSDAVVGSTTVLADTDARAMSEALYRHVAIPDGSSWFQAAVLDGMARRESWTTSVRLWSP